MLNWITDVISRFGAAGIALLMFLENVFPPIPSELIMPLAGFVHARQNTEFWNAVIWGSFGSLAGQGLWFALARRLGEEKVRSFVGRHGRWIAINHHDLDRARDWFNRHGRAAVFLCRLVPGVRTLISVPAGLTGMPPWQFLIYSAAGTFLWTLALAFAGRRLGANYDRVEQYLSPVSSVLAGLFLILYLRRVIAWKPPAGPQAKDG